MAGKKERESERRAIADKLRREQEQREKRRNLLFLVGIVVVVVGLLAAAVIPYVKNQRREHALAGTALDKLGVSESAASCDAILTKKTDHNQQHIPDPTPITYPDSPPSFGPHRPSPAAFERKFYTAQDRPEVATLVHNLEHGYTILWYDSTIKGDQLTALKDLSASARTRDETAPAKFIVSAWDNAYGHFPAGKHIGISHWGAATSHVQLCGKVSGQVVNSFIKKYPAADSPEPSSA